MYLAAFSGQVPVADVTSLYCLHYSSVWTTVSNRISYRIVSYRIVSHRIASYRIVSYRIVSYRIVFSLYCTSTIMHCMELQVISSCSNVYLKPCRPFLQILLNRKLLLDSKDIGYISRTQLSNAVLRQVCN